MDSKLLTDVIKGEKSLFDASREISSNLQALKNELESVRDENNRLLEITLQSLKEAAAHGDFRENADYEIALEKLHSLQNSMVDTVNRLKLINTITDLGKYRSIGLVVLHSTVLLQDNIGEYFLFKVCPPGISDIERHILDKDSRLGKALWLKGLNDKVIVRDSATGVEYTYTILNLY